jgi:hypothetical protein
MPWFNWALSQADVRVPDYERTIPDHSVAWHCAAFRHALPAANRGHAARF